MLKDKTMKKLALIFGIFVGLWGNDSQGGQLLAQICQGVEVRGCTSYFEENCNNGDYHACGIVAQVYRLVGDYKNAIHYGAIACEKIDHNAPATTTTINGNEVTFPKELAKQSKTAECHNIGNTFVEGKHFKVDFSKAIAPFEEACALDSAIDCRNAGIIHLEGGNGVKKDTNRAKKIFAVGCNLGDMQSCQAFRAIKCVGSMCFYDSFNLFN